VWHRSALGLFAATVFIRLSLTAVVLINGAFDQYLINKFQTKELEQLQATKQILDKAESSTAMLSAELESITNQYTSLSKQIVLLRADQSVKRQTLESIKRTAPTCTIIKSTLGKCTLAELDGSAQVERAEEALKAAEASRKAFEKNLEQISERRSCINKKINGESCGIWDTIKGSLPDLNLKQTIQEAKESSEAAIMAFMNLMAIFILKTIVSPLLFWWLFFVGIKAIYRQVSMTK
jgi:chromosome segregation ATPase